MPLHDVFRTIYGFYKTIPTEIEFAKTLELVKLLLSENNIICLEGAEMKQTNKSIADLIDFLQAKWNYQEYDEINYGIWFDKKDK